MQMQIMLFQFFLCLVLSLLVIVAWHNSTAYIGTLLNDSTYQFVNIFTEYTIVGLIKSVVLVAIGLYIGLRYLNSRR